MTEKANSNWTSQIRNLMGNIIVKLKQYKTPGAPALCLESNFFLLVSLYADIILRYFLPHVGEVTK